MIIILNKKKYIVAKYDWKAINNTLFSLERHADVKWPSKIIIKKNLFCSLPKWEVQCEAWMLKKKTKASEEIINVLDWLINRYSKGAIKIKSFYYKAANSETCKVADWGRFVQLCNQKDNSSWLLIVHNWKVINYGIYLMMWICFVSIIVGNRLLFVW